MFKQIEVTTHGGTLVNNLVVPVFCHETKYPAAAEVVGLSELVASQLLLISETRIRDDRFGLIVTSKG